MIARHGSTRHLPKPKLLLDEALPPRANFPKLNSYCDIKHLVQDFNLSGLKDSRVYELAASQDRLLVTFNVKDFRPMITATLPTVIGLSTRLTNASADAKLVSLARKLRPGDGLGKYFSITN